MHEVPERGGRTQDVWVLYFRGFWKFIAALFVLLVSSQSLVPCSVSYVLVRKMLRAFARLLLWSCCLCASMENDDYDDDMAAMSVVLDCSLLVSGEYNLKSYKFIRSRSRQPILALARA